MPLIDAIGSATSGVRASMQDLAATAHNIANLRTAKPTSGEAFRGEQVVRTEAREGGVLTMIVPDGTAEGVVLPEPTHPDADAQGNVRYPNIDIGEQLVGMLVAQQTVEANVATIHRAIDAYRDLLAITSQDRERLVASTS